MKAPLHSPRGASTSELQYIASHLQSWMHRGLIPCSSTSKMTWHVEQAREPSQAPAGQHNASTTRRTWYHPAAKLWMQATSRWPMPTQWLWGSRRKALWTRSGGKASKLLRRRSEATSDDCHGMLRGTFQIDVVVVRSLKHVGSYRNRDGGFRPIPVDKGDCDAARAQAPEADGDGTQSLDIWGDQVTEDRAQTGG